MLLPHLTVQTHATPSSLLQGSFYFLPLLEGSLQRSTVFYIYPKKPSEERLPREAMTGALLCLPSVQTESPSYKRTVRGDFSLACLQKTARNPPLSTYVSTYQAVPR